MKKRSKQIGARGGGTWKGTPPKGTDAINQGKEARSKTFSSQGERQGGEKKESLLQKRREKRKKH